ncbi:MAG TPA: sterol desaturase family protein [Polyangiales bacterium]|nr:sterol desaturase family protein [Polyangiales bacterium]
MSLLIIVAMPMFVLGMMAEYALMRRHRRVTYERKDTIASLLMGTGNVIVSALIKGLVLAFGVVLYRHRFFEIGQGPLAWISLFVVEDFCYYLYHRSHHEVRLLWAAHVNHHSSERYHLATALRQSWTTPLTGFWFWLPLPLLGFHPLMVMTQQAISLIYQFFIHTELVRELGPFEWLFNTPAHHRVHHATNDAYLDRNHGGILIIWDRLLGTFAREDPANAPRYGITKNLQTFNVWTIAFHEWIAIGRDVSRTRGLRNKLGYAFAPPGWSPDGSTLTAKQIRAAAASIEARDARDGRSERVSTQPICSAK